MKIIRFIKDGWYFRIKNVNDKKYVTRRKGQIEKGLGSYTKEKWDWIKLLEERVKKESTDTETERREKRILEKIKELERHDMEMMARFATEKGLIMMVLCEHNFDQFCHYWRWNSKLFLSYLEKEQDEYSALYKKIEVNGGKIEGNWFVARASPMFCANCPGYSPKEKGTYHPE
jgi:hypothetical protein